MNKLEISIKGDPKEIAALVLAVQERHRGVQEIPLKIAGDELARTLRTYMNRNVEGDLDD